MEKIDKIVISVSDESVPVKENLVDSNEKSDLAQIELEEKKKIIRNRINTRFKKAWDTLAEL